MTIPIQPPPMDAWEPGVRAADVPVVEDVEFIPLDPAKADSLEPDREALSQFIGIVFKHASPDGFISLRLFPDKGSKQEKPIDIEPIRIGDKDFLDITVIRAAQAATWHEPAVFCPPVATFRDHKNAKTDNLCEGVCLSVECDQHPLEARADARSPARRGYRRRRVGGEWIKPRDRRDRAESASALAAEKADGHKGGARTASRGARRWRPSWSAATAPISRSFIRSAGPAAGTARARHGSRRSLPSPTTTRSILPKRSSVFATRPAPPTFAGFGVQGRAASSAPTITRP